VIADPAGTEELYTATYDRDDSVLRPLGQVVRHELKARSVENAGEGYAVPSADFHASEALKNSITVAESAAPTGDDPLVVGDLHHGEVRYRRRVLQDAELRALITQILE
jgi:hypothetical protein